LNQQNFHIAPVRYLESGPFRIASFVQHHGGNVDEKTIRSFSAEWTKFAEFTEEEISQAGNEYFDVVTSEVLNKNCYVLDLGCGSGRWSRYIADRVGFIEAIDPGDSVFAAARLLADKKNVRVSQASSDEIPFADNSFDFVMSLGVLHHIPDTRKALHDLVSKLRPGGYALLYFYYNFENRSALYRFLFQISNVFRLGISRLPAGLKKIVCDLIAFGVYLPLVLFARIVKASGGSKFYRKLPLSYYIGKSFHIMRNDALDRFGTPLEKRFSKDEIVAMCTSAGLEAVAFSENTPYWHLTARKKEYA
jgi:SAM-dependent methyltransferase